MRTTILSLIGAISICSCQTTSLNEVEQIILYPVLKIEASPIEVEPTVLKRNESLFVANISPTLTVTPSQNTTLNLKSVGRINLDQNTVFFLNRSRNGEDIFCSLQNNVKSVINGLYTQLCISDDNADNIIDRYFVRSGASPKDAEKFLYYDAEAYEVYSEQEYNLRIEETPFSERYDIALRFDKFSTSSGQKKAEFDILIRPQEANSWELFPVRDKLTLDLTELGRGNLSLPFADFQMSIETGSSIRVEVKFKPDSTNLGFRRQIENSNGFYSPAYQIY